MKLLRRLLVVLGLTASLGLAAAAFSTVPFTVGPHNFRLGDNITLDRVSATSPNFTVGDTVVVRGHYQLGSHDQAKILLILTQTGTNEPEKISPMQTITVSKGSAEFELRYTVTHVGALHVSLYPVGKGNSFGGVYFGTPAQMEKIRDWTIEL